MLCVFLAFLAACQSTKYIAGPVCVVDAADNSFDCADDMAPSPRERYYRATYFETNNWVCYSPETNREILKAAVEGATK